MSLKKILSNPCIYQSPNGRSKGRFRPHGRVYAAGKRVNPFNWRSSESLYRARLLVGFNVGGEPRWKMSDLVSAVKRYLREAKMPEDSSYVYQRGVYTHSRSGHVVTEEGAQVVILKFPYSAWDDLSTDEFFALMFRLGEYLADALSQEEVIVETGKGGNVIETAGMSGLEYKP